MFLFVSQEKRKALVKAAFLMRFEYCPIVRVSPNRALTYRIKGLHERVLRLTSKNSFFFFSVKNDMTKTDQTHFHNRKNKYTLRNNSNLKSSNINTVLYATENILSL